MLMKEERRVAAVINEGAVETRSNIIPRRKATSSLGGIQRRKFSQRSSILFHLFSPSLFPMEVNVVGQRAGSSFLSLFFSTSVPTARPCRFIFVAKRNTKFAGVWPRGTLVRPGSRPRKIRRRVLDGSTGRVARVSERKIKLFGVYRRRGGFQETSRPAAAEIIISERNEKERWTYLLTNSNGYIC